MDLNDDIAKLKTEILAVFPRASPPGASKISDIEGPQIPSLKLDFADKTWWSVDAEMIVANVDKLPLFSPLSYHYYLPAYLLAALEDFVESNDAVQFSVYGLCPFLDSEVEEAEVSFRRKADRIYWEQRRDRFNYQERKVILEFLELVIQSESFDWELTFAKRAKEFWTDS